MSMKDIVDAAKAQFVLDQDGAVQKYGESVYTGAFSEGAASVPPPDADEQAKIDAAVKAAVDPLQAQIAQDALDLAASIQDGLDKIAAVQVSLDAMTAKELAEEGVVQGLKDAVAAFQSVLAGLPQPQA